jgi:hypothetical protein
LAFIFSLHAQAARRSGKANADPQENDVRQKSAAEVRRHPPAQQDDGDELDEGHHRVQTHTHTLN